MKFITKILTAATVAIGLAAAPSAALAQKVAYYDHGKVIGDSKAWKAIESQLKGKRDEITAKLQPIASEVSTEGEKLKKETDGMKPEDAAKKYGTRITTLRQKVAGLEMSQQRANQELNIVSELAQSKINATVAGIMDDVAKKEKVDVILRKDGLGYYNSKFDVTDTVLAELNRSLGTLSIDGLIAEVQQRQAAVQN